MKVTVGNNQTLADIAVQVYGSIAAMPLLAKTNDVSMSDELTPGMVLDCPDAVYDRYLQNYVKMNNITPATK